MSTPTTAPEPAEAEPPPVTARPAEFPRLDPRGGPAEGTTLDSLRDVPITITAELGHAVLQIADVLRLGPGAVVELEESLGEPIQLTVRGVPFALGEVVVVEDHFAIRIKKLLPPRGGRGES